MKHILTLLMGSIFALSVVVSHASALMNKDVALSNSGHSTQSLFCSCPLGSQEMCILNGTDCDINGLPGKCGGGKCIPCSPCYPCFECIGDDEITRCRQNCPKE